jgi:hypothetical protein
VSKAAIGLVQNHIFAQPSRNVQICANLNLPRASDETTTKLRWLLSTDLAVTLLPDRASRTVPDFAGKPYQSASRIRSSGILVFHPIGNNITSPSPCLIHSPTALHAILDPDFHVDSSLLMTRHGQAVVATLFNDDYQLQTSYTFHNISIDL